MAVITSARRAETIKTEGLHNVADVRRLYLEVSWRQRGEERSPANGVTRSWIYRFKSPITGKVRNMGLGSSRDLGFADAKEKALAAAKQLLEGKDPIIERDREREATRQAYQRDIASRVTFKDVGKLPQEAPSELPQRQAPQPMADEPRPRERSLRLAACRRRRQGRNP